MSYDRSDRRDREPRERLDRDTEYLLRELLDAQGRDWGPLGYGAVSARTKRLVEGGYVETRKVDATHWQARLTDSAVRVAERVRVSR